MKVIVLFNQKITLNFPKKNNTRIPGNTDSVNDYV